MTCECKRARKTIREEFPYDIGDIVNQNGHDEFPLVVTGYITDQQRLFVRDPSGALSKGDEFEMHFCEVTDHWRRVKPNATGERPETRSEDV